MDDDLHIPLVVGGERCLCCCGTQNPKSDPVGPFGTSQTPTSHQKTQKTQKTQSNQTKNQNDHHNLAPHHDIINDDSNCTNILPATVEQLSRNC